MGKNLRLKYRLKTTKKFSVKMICKCYIYFRLVISRPNWDWEIFTIKP